MKASVSKVENACYNMHVRGSEKPDGWTLDLKDERKRGDREEEDNEFGAGGRGGKRRRLDDD